eukprot:TRINITY_DN2237_c0_g1_i2.p1 TRINITY_DN2237_c0_g1~~TRINITY_DN2237_c0_g1_i2.p1  ORF type:complete len:726 (+),score=129.13 TRINITY_DN2237_c0_g1_i2:2563-4740(+)
MGDRDNERRPLLNSGNQPTEYSHTNGHNVRVDMNNAILSTNNNALNTSGTVPTSIPSYQFPGWGKSGTLSISHVGTNPSPLGDMANMADIPYPSINSEEATPINDPNEPMEFKEEDVTLLGRKDESLDLRGKAHDPVKPVDASDPHKIGQWLATAICGNDITSSIFYTTSICATSAGKWAPVSLLLVCLVLYLYRKVYGEVGSALPLNGGAYNILLNTTTKLVASLAACLTLISYIATAVVSAQNAMLYLYGLWDGFNLFWSPIVLLAFFALLNMMGIGESAKVALGIFVVHMVTLLMLVFGTFIELLIHRDWSVLLDNWHAPTHTDFITSIYFGFGAAMLGISGFETSSNFIEQQKPGVFPKTLRNMWIAVTFFNPVIGVLAIATLPLATITDPNKSAGILSTMAQKSVGPWLSKVVSIDAFLVLSGSVITSYVGIIGLARRMSLDRCLPQFLLHVNSFRRTNHWIIIVFFAVCSLLYIMVDGNVETLAGVYTIAFLGVMSLFAMGNMLLKYKRSSIPRAIRASWPAVAVALCSTVAGLIATIITNPLNLQYFAIYFVGTAFIIGVTLIRTKLLKIMLFFAQIILRRFIKTRDRVTNSISDAIKKINSQSVVFLASKDDPAYLNKAILYVRDNEQTNWIRIVHVYEDESQIPPDLSKNVEFLDHCYPKIRLDLITVHGVFCPETVEKIGEILDIPKNFMFIACPKERLPHHIGEFGGVRMITSF